MTTTMTRHCNLKLERQPQQSFSVYLQHYIDGFMKLAEFYNSNGAKAKKWALKKALRAKHDR